MAREPKVTPPIEETSDSKRIILSAPVAHSEFSYLVSSADTYVLNFDPSKGTYNRVGDALEIRFENGAVIFLMGYFAEAPSLLPSLETQNGDAISSSELLIGEPFEVDPLMAASNEEPNTADGHTPPSQGSSQTENPLAQVAGHSSETSVLDADVTEDDGDAQSMVAAATSSLHSDSTLSAMESDTDGPEYNPAIVASAENKVNAVSTFAGNNSDGQDSDSQVAAPGAETSLNSQMQDGESTDLEASLSPPLSQSANGYSSQNPDGQSPDSSSQNGNGPAQGSANSNSQEPASPADGGEQPDSSSPNMSSGVGEYRPTTGNDSPPSSQQGTSIPTDDNNRLPANDTQWVSSGEGKQDSGSQNSSSQQPTPLAAIDLPSVFGGGAGGATVYESGLRNGTTPGKGDVSAWQEMVLPDGVAVVGVPRGESAVINGEFGSLIIQHLHGNTYQYRYQLKSAYAKNAGNSSAASVDAEVISFEVTNGSETVTAKIAIDIVDDAPWVQMVQTSPSDTPVYSGQEVNGVWRVDYGADGANPTSSLVVTFKVGDGMLNLTVTPGQAQAVVINGVNYGSILFNNNGSYVFTAAANVAADLSMYMVATDGDGDSTHTGSTTITIMKPPFPGEYLGENCQVSESGLADGSAPGAGVSTEIPLPAGYTLVLDTHQWVAQKDASGKDCFVLEGPYGKLTYYAASDTEAAHLVYTLLNAAPHVENSNTGDTGDLFYDRSFGSFTFVDTQGNLYEMESAFKVQDDTPKVDFTSKDDSVASVGAGGTFTGEWNAQFGADGPAQGSGLKLIVTLKNGETNTIDIPDGFGSFDVVIGVAVYGTMTLMQDGTYSFVASDQSGELDFVLVAIDGDGDTASSGHFGLTIEPSTPLPPYLGYGYHFNEANLQNGTDPNPDLITQQIALPEGYTIDLSDGWLDHGKGMFVKVGEYGYLITNADGSTLSYQLMDAVKNDSESAEIEGDTGYDIFKDIVLTGKNGDKTSLDAKIEIRDDSPAVDFGGDSNAAVAPGSSFTGTWGVNFGADGPFTDTPLRLVVSVNGKSENFNFIPGKAISIDLVIAGKSYGLLELNPNGTYTFKPSADMAESTDIGFSLRATDADGDKGFSNNGDNFVITVGGSLEIKPVELTLYEANLPGGTDADAAALQQAITLPEGYKPVLTDWTLFGGSYFLSTEIGTFTYSRSQGMTFTLQKTLQHSETGSDPDQISLKLADLSIQGPDGQIQTLRVNAQVWDDAPKTAFGGNEGNSVIISSDESYEGVWYAACGADGPAKNGIVLKVSLADSTSETVSLQLKAGEASNHTILIDGKAYGVLNMRADGSYTFNAAKNVSGVLDFVLTATDGDGDVRSSDGFKIGILADEGPGVSALEGQAYEAYGTNGTQDKGDSEEGLQFITLPAGSRVDYSHGGWAKDTNNPDEYVLAGTSANHGSLVTNADGTWLAYRCGSAFTHGSGDEPALDIFDSIRLVGQNGKSYDLPVRVQVLDDAPISEISGSNDSAIATGDSFTGQWKGLFGADGPSAPGAKPMTLAVTIEGKEYLFEIGTGAEGAVEIIVGNIRYGSLTLNENGTFRYQSLEDMPDIESIGFVLKLTDSDGDSAASGNGTPFVVRFGQSNPDSPNPVALENAIDEAWLAEGTQAGEGALTQVFTLSDGYSVALDSWELEEGAYVKNVPNGTLSYNKDTGEISFTLTAPVTHSGQDADSKDLTLAEFDVKDKDGTLYTQRVTGTIIDDAPEVVFAGVDSVSAATMTGGESYIGAWSAAFGADGHASEKALSLTISLSGKEGASLTLPLTPGETSSHDIIIDGVNYGSLNLLATGGYQFTAMSSASGVLEFALTALDGDGDQSTSDSFKLTIQENPNPGEVTAIEGTIYESYGPGGSQAKGDSQEGLQFLKVPSDYRVDTSYGPWEENENNPGVFVMVDTTINRGGLVADSTGTWIAYRSGAASTHTGTDPVYDLFESVRLVHKTTGETIDIPVKVLIIDDVPVADIAGDNGEALALGQAFVGEWTGLFGIDGASTPGIRPMTLTVVIDGEQHDFKIGSGTRGRAEIKIGDNNYGTVVLDADGKFQYQSLEDMPTIDSIGFILTLTDGDGDTASSLEGKPFVINLRQPDALEPVTLDKALDEALLENGTEAGAGSLTQTFSLADGYSVVLTSWEQKDNLYTKEVENGVLTYDAETGEIAFTLTKAVTHTAQGNDSRTLTLAEFEVKSADGSVGTQRLLGSITDDTPEVSFTDRTGGQGSTVVEGSSIDGVWSVNYGADGAASSQNLVLTVSLGAGGAGNTITIPVTPGQTSHDVVIGGVNYGTIMLDDNGTYSFAAKSQQGMLNFSLAATDGDGDVSQTSGFRITITDADAPSIPYLGFGHTVKESYFTGGTEEKTGDQDALQFLSVPTGFYIDVNDGNWTALAEDVYVLYSQTGGLVTNANGTWLAYRVGRAVNHNGSDILETSGNSAFDVFEKIKLVDGKGDAHYLDARIEILNDTPSAELSVPNLDALTIGESIQGTWDCVFGADGPATSTASMVLTVSIMGKTYDFSVGADMIVDIVVDQANYGRVSLNNDGTFSYASSASMPATEEIGFLLTLVNGEGTRASSNEGELFFIPLRQPGALASIDLGSLDEAWLADGTDANAAALVKTFDLPEGFTPVLSDGWVLQNNAYVYKVDTGYFSYTQGAGKMTYTMTGPVEHSANGADSRTVNLGEIRLQGASGEEVLRVNANVIDDTPEVTFNSKDGNIVLMEPGDTFSAGTWNVQYGADKATEGGALSLRVQLVGSDQYALVQVENIPGSYDITIGGKRYGTLSLDNNGTFSFNADGGATGELKFSLTAVDSDGDRVSTGGFHTVIQEEGGPDIPYLGYGETFSEAHLADGSNPAPGSLARYISMPEGYRVDVSDWTPYTGGTYIKMGTWGALSCNADGTGLAYMLRTAVKNNGDNTDNTDTTGYDLIPNITLISQSGKEYTLNAKIAIRDDVPEVALGGNSEDSISHGENFTGTWSAHYGADGPASRSPMNIKVTVDGKERSFAVSTGDNGSVDLVIDGTNYGRIVFNENGTYSYSMDETTPDAGSIAFVLSVTDGDGDTAHSNNGKGFVLNLMPKSSLAPIELPLIDEANLANGDAAALVRTFSLPEDCTLVLDDWKADGSFYVMQAKNGILSYNPNSGQVTYTLTSPVDHSGVEGGEKALTICLLAVRTAGGDVEYVKLSTTVLDSAPVLDFVSGDSQTLDSGNSFSTDAVLLMNFGADGDGYGKDHVVRVDYSYEYTSGGRLLTGTSTVYVPKNGSRVSFVTSMGEGLIFYDEESGRLAYKYEAVRGQRSDAEKITFSITDGDGNATTAEANYSLNGDVSVDTISLYESGLSVGSNSFGSGPAYGSKDIDPSMLQSDATKIEWNTSSIAALKADGNLDGSYANVTWEQSGNNLRGYADSQMVIEVVPRFDGDGHFTGTMSATLYRPFSHTSSDMLDLNLSFKQIYNEETKAGKQGSITVSIKDDAPFGGEISQGATHVGLTGGQSQEVYLVMDMGLSAGEARQFIIAARELVQKYQQSDVDVSFTLVSYTGTASVRITDASASELLTHLTADNAGLNWVISGLTSGRVKNYTKALDATKTAIESSMQNPDNAGTDRTVYFLTSGVQTTEVDGFRSSWVPFVQQTSNLDVYALGVGGSFTSASSAGNQTLTALTGNADNVKAASTWNTVSTVLLSQYHEEGRSQLLPGNVSADKSTLLFVLYGEEPNVQTYQMKSTGDSSSLKNTGPIPLSGGASLTIYEDGTYRISSSEKLGDDFKGTIKLTYRDADGDQFSSGDIVLSLNPNPETPSATAPGDHMSQYNPGYDHPTLLGNFATAMNGNTDSQQWLGHNVAWAAQLPYGMSALPSDPSLAGFSDGKLMRLSASSLSADSVQKHFGNGTALSEIIEDLGIPYSSSQVSDGGASRIALASKSFSCSGGEVVFNWSFSGVCGKGEADAAFWVLLDDQNRVIDSGRLNSMQQSSGIRYENGVAHIQLPDSDSPHTYKLVLGTVDGGVTSGTAATLCVDTVALLDSHYDFSGNLLTDQDADGQINGNSFGTVSSITYSGNTYQMSGSELTIQLESGTLTVNQNGTYRMNLNQGVDPATVLEELSYSLSGQGNADDATLTLQGGRPVAEDGIATVEHGYQHMQQLSMFDAPAALALNNHGWSYACERIFTAYSPSTTTLNPLPEAPSDDFLTSPTAQAYMSATKALSDSEKQSFFGTSNISSITQILNDAGVNGSTFGGLGSTVHAGVMQKSFSTTGGKLAFSWSFRGGNSAADNDAAFWILKDSKGNVVKSGLLHQGKGAESGTTFVDIDSTDDLRSYSIVFGMVNTGSSRNESPQIMLGNVALFEGEYHYTGNVLEDTSPDGLSDQAYYTTKLDTVTFAGQTKSFGDDNTVVFNTDKGTLTVNSDGNYYFNAKDGKPYSVSEEFSYTLRGAAEDNSATVEIKAAGPYAPHIVGDYDGNQTNVISHLQTNTFSTITGRSMHWSSNSYDKSWAPDILGQYFDNQYLRLYSSGTLQDKRADILGNSSMSFQELIESVGLEGQLVNPSNPRGTFIQRSFTSKGGMVLFDWMASSDTYQDSIEMDGALWILRDEKNNIISSGKLFQVTTGSHSGVNNWTGGGVGVVSIPPTDESKQYTLVVGTVQIGSSIGRDSGLPNLLIDAFAHVEAAFQFKGNIFEEMGYDGYETRAGENAVIGMIEYKGQTYMMDSSGVISIKTDSGATVTFIADGSYSLTTGSSDDGRNIAEDFIYTILDPQDGSALGGKGLINQGVLSLRGDQYQYEGTDGNDVIDHSNYSTPDIIRTGDGNDFYLGGLGNEQVFAGEGNDTIYANAGNNRIYGGGGDDEIYGGTGNDTIHGGSGNDLIMGGDGNDAIYGGTGTNTLWGGNGADTFGWKSQTELSGKDILMDFNSSEGDKLGFDQLFDTRQDMNTFFRGIIGNLNLNVEKDEMSFTINGGAFAKEVEVHFDAEADSGYLSVKNSYMAAVDPYSQQEILAQFLFTIAANSQ